MISLVLTFEPCTILVLHHYFDEWILLEQVLECRGDKGHNVEYVLKLAEWIRDKLPEVQDEHLFEIEISVRRKIEERGLRLTTLMGDNCGEESVKAQTEKVEQSLDSQEDHENTCENASGFSAQVKPKCLRCVKV